MEKAAATPTLFQHPARPAWGRCIIVAERDAKVFLHCEDGEEHALAATHKGTLAQVQVSVEEATAVAASITEQRATNAARAARRSSKKPSAPKAPRMTFDAQLERFLAKFPGGFAGEAFAAQRAGKDAAIARAQAQLTPEFFSTPDAFRNLATLLSESGLVHPMEVAVPFKGIVEADQPTFLSTLSALIHGSGDYAPRFDAFVAAVKIAQADGSAKRPSWPFTSVFPALARPTEHAFIKPKLLQEQAGILGVKLDYQPLPSGAVYEQFRQLLRTLGEQLEARGQKARDLFDVGTFAALTLAAEAPLEAAAPAADTPPQ